MNPMFDRYYMNPKALVRDKESGASARVHAKPKRYGGSMRRRMQQGGVPPVPPNMHSVGQASPGIQSMQRKNASSQQISPAMRALIVENERLKQAMQMMQIQMQKQEMINKGKTPPSEHRMMQVGPKKSPKKRGGAIKRKRY